MSFENEEEYLEEQYANGEITLREFNAQMMELHRDYLALAEEAAKDAAQEAYDNEIGRW